MWNNHRLLNRIASTLYALASMTIAYAAVTMVAGLPVFALNEVQVEGDVAHTSREQVRAAAARELRGTFFTLELEQARAAFEKLPWVRIAHVRRVWPDRLQVTLEEHVPLARWHDHGLVNTHGEVFDAATDLVLPVFAGPEGSAAEMARNFVRFRDLLATVDRTPVEIRLSVRGAWQITLDDGQLLELGRQDLLPRLVRFVTAYRAIVVHVPSGGRIDLRYANGFAVRQPGLRWRERPV